LDAYKGIPIPKSVRELFQLGQEEDKGPPVKIGFERQTYKGRSIDVLKIGGRQCTRLTEDQLEEVARKHHIPGVLKGMGLAKMCAKIGASIIRAKAKPPAFELAGIKYYVEGEHIKGAPRRNGKPNPGRKCATIPTETLYKYARAMGIDPSGKSKPQICKEMQEKKQPERVVVVPEVVKPEPKVDKKLERFKDRIGNAPFKQSQYREWEEGTPAQKARLIVQIKRHHKLETLINSLDPKEFKANLMRYASGKTEADIKDYLTKLRAASERLKRQEKEKFVGARALNVETM